MKQLLSLPSQKKTPLKNAKQYALDRTRTGDLLIS